MSWLSKAIDKVSDVVKDVAKPIVAIVDPGVSLSGAYGNDVKELAATNIEIGAVGAAAIASGGTTATSTASSLLSSVKPTVTPEGSQTGQEPITYQTPEKRINLPGQYRLQKQSIAPPKNSGGIQLDDKAYLIIFLVIIAIVAAALRAK